MASYLHVEKLSIAEQIGFTFLIVIPNIVIFIALRIANPGWLLFLGAIPLLLYIILYLIYSVKFIGKKYHPADRKFFFIVSLLFLMTSITFVDFNDYTCTTIIPGISTSILTAVCAVVSCANNMLIIYALVRMRNRSVHYKNRNNN